MDGITCRNKDNGGCKEMAMFRYTWPGNDESYACPDHARALRGAANAIGLHLQLIPLTDVDHLAAEPQQEQRNE